MNVSKTKLSLAGVVTVVLIGLSSFWVYACLINPTMFVGDVLVNLLGFGVIIHTLTTGALLGWLTFFLVKADYRKGNWSTNESIAEWRASQILAD